MPELDPNSVFVGLVAGAVLGYVYAHAERLVANLWRNIATRLLGPDVYR